MFVFQGVSSSDCLNPHSVGQPGLFFGLHERDIPGLGDLIPGLGGELPSTSPDKPTSVLSPLPDEPCPEVAQCVDPPPPPPPMPPSAEVPATKPLMDIDTSQSPLPIPGTTSMADVEQSHSKYVEIDVSKINKHSAGSSVPKVPLSQRLMQLADYDTHEKNKGEDNRMTNTDDKKITMWVKDQNTASTDLNKNPGAVLFSSPGFKDTTLRFVGTVESDDQAIPGLDMVKSDSEEESEKPKNTSPLLKSHIKQDSSAKPQAFTSSESDEDEEGTEDDDDIAMTALRAQLILGMKQKQERKIQQLDVSELIWLSQWVKHFLYGHSKNSISFCLI